MEADDIWLDIILNVDVSEGWKHDWLLVFFIVIVKPETQLESGHDNIITIFFWGGGVGPVICVTQTEPRVTEDVSSLWTSQFYKQKSQSCGNKLNTPIVQVRIITIVIEDTFTTTKRRAAAAAALSEWRRERVNEKVRERGGAGCVNWSAGITIAHFYTFEKKKFKFILKKNDNKHVKILLNGKQALLSLTQL